MQEALQMVLGVSRLAFVLGPTTQGNVTQVYKVLKAESMSKWIVGIVMNFARKILNVGRGKCPIAKMQSFKREESEMFRIKTK